MPTHWASATFRGEVVWAGLRNPTTRQPALVEGLVPFRYQTSAGATVYRTRRANLTADLIPTVRELPPGRWADDATSRPTEADGEAARQRVGQLERELADARIRIRELMREIVDLRKQGKGGRRQQPIELPDLDELLALCHPDRHPEARAAVANRVTGRLLDLKRGRK